MRPIYDSVKSVKSKFDSGESFVSWVAIAVLTEFTETWFQHCTKDFLSEGGCNGFHGINGNANLHETVKDFLRSDGNHGFHGIYGKMNN